MILRYSRIFKRFISTPTPQLDCTASQIPNSLPSIAYNVRRSFAQVASLRSDQEPTGESTLRASVSDATVSADRLSHGLFKVASLSSCPGCGAFAQTVEKNEAGYYTLKRRAVKDYLESYGIYIDQAVTRQKPEDAVNEKALTNTKPALDGASQKGETPAEEPNKDDENAKEDVPLCDRCHLLLHHHTGNPIYHPSVDSLADTMAESPYKYNHIYHVLDAADFPMSLVPRITDLLSLSPLRGQNRRAKHSHYIKGRKAELSFVITRSDLLAPKKEQVDSLMPTLISILRDALGRAGRNVRLGNVYCVSSKRGWWTKDVKTDIWKRGGAGWMVGKVNVGKSNLFETVFPKGKANLINFESIRATSRRNVTGPAEEDQGFVDGYEDASQDGEIDENALLPPARKEIAFPVMPTVSSLPGTTASPIRIPFGRGKGELIDLPGLKRTNLEDIVNEQDRASLVMKNRVAPEQLVLKPGQSLLIGGLVRITPKTKNLVVMAYPFVPLATHITSTEKAEDMETGAKQEVLSSILKEDHGTKMTSAGIFTLDTDVTRERAGPLTKKSAVGMKPDRLPFQVVATDILIESVGWVELVAQIRRPRQRYETDLAAEQERRFPQVELFSPNGKFVSSRRSLGAWLIGKPLVKETARPRRSLSDARRVARAVT